jgi:hypothetical protein
MTVWWRLAPQIFPLTAADSILMALPRCDYYWIIHNVYNNIINITVQSQLHFIIVMMYMYWLLPKTPFKLSTSFIFRVAWLSIPLCACCNVAIDEATTRKFLVFLHEVSIDTFGADAFSFAL